jgi:hypothetical protein
MKIKIENEEERERERRRDDSFETFYSSIK